MKETITIITITFLMKETTKAKYKVIKKNQQHEFIYTTIYFTMFEKGGIQDYKAAAAAVDSRVP